MLRANSYLRKAGVSPRRPGAGRRRQGQVVGDDRRGEGEVGAAPGTLIAQPCGTFASSSASQAAGPASEGIRQSPRGDIVPPALTLGPLGSAERLNWLAKNRLHEDLAASAGSSARS